MREYQLRPRPGEHKRPEAEMTDESQMKFGKHKGKMLKDVPASYFLWLWDNGLYAKTGDPLHHYMKEALSTFETEYPDYIIQHPIKP